MLVFLGVWETMLIFFVASRIVGVRLNRQTWLLTALAFAVFVYVVRSLFVQCGLPFGLHTIVCVLAAILLLRSVAPMGWGRSTAGVLIAFQLLLLGEFLSYPVLSRLGPTEKALAASPALHIAMGWVGMLPLIILGLLVWRFNLHLRIPERLPQKGGLSHDR